MKKITLVLIFASFFNEKVNCQITKGYWLAGGNASYYVQKSTSTGAVVYSNTEISVSGGVGFFPINKFAVGLRPLFTYAGAPNLDYKFYTYGVSPFLRYYFLKPQKILNLFAETNYSFENTIQRAPGNDGSTKGNAFSLMAGPVIFLNSSIGLEFAFGYLIHTVPGFGQDYNRTQLKIGFQYHLIKDKEK